MSILNESRLYELATPLGTVEDVVQCSLRKLEARNSLEVSRLPLQIGNPSELGKLAG